jgi:hypothetical protein
MQPLTSHPIVEEVLGAWTEALGPDFAAYRGHVYRVLSFARALASASPEGSPSPGANDTIAVAAVFHDLGIWSDSTFDYLAPSEARARAFLHTTDCGADEEAVVAMIAMHHKLLPYRGPHRALVEPFRRADLLDVSLGLLRAGLPRAFVREVRAVFPNAGFHARLGRLIAGHALRHPLHPLPMLRL